MKVIEMDLEERNTIANIITTFIVLAVIGSKMWQMHLNGEFAGPDGVMIWARMVLWMIPACIVVIITVTILFNIAYSAMTGTEHATFLIDERDAAIGRRGMQVTMVVASIGFMLAIIAMALGWTAFAGLNIILIGFAAGDILGSLSKMAAYRFGI